MERIKKDLIALQDQIQQWQALQLQLTQQISTAQHRIQLYKQTKEDRREQKQSCHSCNTSKESPKLPPHATAVSLLDLHFWNDLNGSDLTHISSMESSWKEYPSLSGRV